MKLFVALVAVIAVCQAASLFDTIKEEWEQFKTTYGKKYENEFIEIHRMKVFIKNREKVAEHNQRYEEGLVSYKLGMNKFGDLETHEFTKMMNGFNRTQGIKRAGSTYIPPANVQLPDSVDWRTQGAVAEVKDQAQCGSCWAFSATGSLEGQHFRKTGQLVSLSEQNLMDCSTSEGNAGCGGGWMDQAFVYIKKNNGIDTEVSYPYEARDAPCRFNAANVGATDNGYYDIPSGSESDLQSAVATVGPISVAIDASHFSFQLYSGGIYIEQRCSPNDLDHGVLVVGYGSENGQDYWLIKNSWGTGWGLNGYMKMARNYQNHCGVATSASYPVV